MTSKVENHWGKWVDSETPVTGVISNNNVEFLNEECDSGIDLHYEEYEEEKELERENRILESEENGEEYEEEEEEEDFYEDDSPVYLIGDWKKDETGKYEPDKEGESGFSAITSYDSFNCTQVLWSKWTKKGALCSPCFPGQVDLDSEGDFLGYTLPEDLIGFKDEK